MGKRVLIVDDAYFMRNLIKKVLKEAGYEVVDEAKNGREGITKYFELKPDFVTMDINMPDISGIEATRQILSKDPHARIIAVTGSDSDEVKAEMMAAGAKEYLKKPFQPAFLLTKIENMFLEEETPSSSDQEDEAVVTPVSPGEVEEDFFENMDFDLPNKPDESLERLLVIENNEDRIEFPEEFVAEERDKFALTKDAIFEEEEPLQEEQSNETPKQPVEEVLEEKVQQEPALENPARQLISEEPVIEKAVPTPPTPAPAPTPPPRREESNSYIQIRPPRGKVLSQPDYRPYEKDEDLVEPIINDSDGGENAPSQKKGFFAKLISKFTNN